MVSPVTVIGLAAPETGGMAGLFAVTVYLVIPQVPAGAVKVTAAVALPATAVTLVGAPGITAGITAFDAADAGLLPVELTAVTVKV